MSGSEEPKRNRSRPLRGVTFAIFALMLGIGTISYYLTDEGSGWWLSRRQGSTPPWNTPASDDAAGKTLHADSQSKVSSEPLVPSPAAPAEVIATENRLSPQHSTPAIAPVPTFTNTLGMEFLPVQGTAVLFCRWETRVKDYRAFAEATKREVVKVDFEQTGTDPVVNVSWNDAKAFCSWLSEKEGRHYRLPTDSEWGIAVGGDLYPWGTQWPPPAGSGNYADASAKGKRSQAVIPGYEDGYPNTAPVGKFAQNYFGIVDLGGNIWEWCHDLSPEGTARVRGGSFTDSFKDSLKSTNYYDRLPTTRTGNHGFRVVVTVK